MTRILLAFALLLTACATPSPYYKCRQDGGSREWCGGYV